jgi:MFS family permease
VLGNLSGIFSGLLAFAFDTVSGAHGLSGWQWLFLAEGLITIVLGVAVMFILPDCKPIPIYDSHFKCRAAEY